MKTFNSFNKKIDTIPKELQDNFDNITKFYGGMPEKVSFHKNPLYLSCELENTTVGFLKLIFAKYYNECRIWNKTTNLYTYTFEEIPKLFETLKQITNINS